MKKITFQLVFFESLFLVAVQFGRRHSSGLLYNTEILPQFLVNILELLPFYYSKRERQLHYAELRRTKSRLITFTEKNKINVEFLGITCGVWGDVS